MKNILFLFLALTIMSACNEPAKTETVQDEKKVEETPNYTLTSFENSFEYNDASLKNMMYKNGQFTYDVSGEKYKLGAQTPDAERKMCANSGKGQHIHLIVDNKPYAAKYTSEFEYDLDNGEHYILSFLSRSYHESIKTKDAHIAKKVMIADGSFVSSRDITEPMIFYSRPKGTYVGKDTEKVMLDFYLANVNLSDGYTVQISINGVEYNIGQWKPYYIEGLPMGENKITLTLLDKNGAKVNSPYNPVTRIFELKADPTPEG